jgi:protein gp37
MNKQNKGNGSRGIEWTDFTWNPIGGCLHGCAWTMPDGTIANCYAEDVANRLAQQAYPHGFEHHYYKPGLLDEPLKLKTPAKIFCGSMADVFGHWVPMEQIQAVLDVCRQAHWHTFQFLTKNPRRLIKFDFPPNCWVGISSPPDQMWGKPLSAHQRTQWLWSSLNALNLCNARVQWMSIEPLSRDIYYDLR